MTLSLKNMEMAKSVWLEVGHGGCHSTIQRGVIRTGRRR